jgi:murein DD-endopeptidase MepM/ murein hydrolase activator NlpD
MMIGDNEKMTKYLTKKLSLITITLIFVIISVVIAVQIHTKPGVSTSVAEIDNSQLQSVIADQNNNEILATKADEQVPEKNTEIVIEPSAGNDVKNVRTDDSVSRGTRTTNPISNTMSNDSANFWQNRQTWLQPVKGLQIAAPNGGLRYFGAPRANGRAHAAIDFIAPNGTPVYAMTDGKVIRTSLFFENTYAVEVQNTDGTIARYGEIAPAVSVNKIVQRGDVIGKIITNYGGTSMLHLEMYMGTASGSLSQENNTNTYKYVTLRNYERRSDLIDPTRAKDLPIK